MVLIHGLAFLCLSSLPPWVFQDAGVDVKLVEFTSSGDVSKSFERGYVDIATATSVDLATLNVGKARKPQVFYVTDFSNGADVILARPDIQSIADAKGKRVAAEVGSLDMLHLLSALKKHNLTIDDITLLNVSQHEMAPAWERGEFDVAVTTPESHSLSELGAHKIFDSSMIPGAIIDLLVSDEALIQERTDDFTKIIHGIEKARAWAKINPDEALGLLAKHLQSTPDTLKADMELMHFIPLEEQSTFLSANSAVCESISPPTKYSVTN